MLFCSVWKIKIAKGTPLPNSYMTISVNNSSSNFRHFPRSLVNSTDEKRYP